MPRRFLLFLLLLAALTPLTLQAEWYSQQAAIMGTRIAVQIWQGNEAKAQRAMEAVLAEFHRLDQALSPYIERSELNQVNLRAARRPVPISQEFYDLLVEALDYSKLTQGAFDITYASIGHQYDYRKGIKPSEEALASSLPLINYQLVKLDPDTHSISFEREGVHIDLGGIAKGYAVDQAIELLRRAGIEHALVTAGGDSRLLGDHQGRPWHIGIQAPRNHKAMAAVLPLSDSAISTSGDYERYFEADGVRYHHIISPKTGRSADELQSVTILGPNATRTDALSTSVFVLGLKEGMALIDRLEDVEAVIIDNRGEIHTSKGLEHLPSPATTGSN